MPKVVNGISLCICCHNSANRIEATLKHLQAQVFTQKINWEVLLIDNQSSDGTTQKAESLWRDNPVTVLKIIPEPKLGLSHARKRAFSASQYDIIGFIDDDNWADPYWAERAIKNFNQDPNIGACSGRVLPACEITEPKWFQSYKGNYSTWDLYPKAQTIQHPLGGAGLCLRKSAIESLFNLGFKMLLSDRQGKKLSSGGDFELCYALLLMGWKIQYDPDLTIHHFIPKERLSWSYLIRLQEGFGKQSTILEQYEEVYQSILKQKKPTQKTLWKEVLYCIYRIIRHAHNGCFPKNHEGSINAILWMQQLGRLKELLKLRKEYTTNFQSIVTSNWIHK